MDDWATIRHRFANEKISKRELAKQLGVSRGTVDRALAQTRRRSTNVSRQGLRSTRLRRTRPPDMVR
ncbi:GntR family transcriptional regulator [Arthrobacter sp. SDTb3-6]|nr:GntR family transcriptional regulator [Arthrobacter sp. SDTb3-6]